MPLIPAKVTSDLQVAKSRGHLLALLTGLKAAGPVLIPFSCWKTPAPVSGVLRTCRVFPCITRT